MIETDDNSTRTSNNLLQTQTAEAEEVTHGLITPPTFHELVNDRPQVTSSGFDSWEDLIPPHSLVGSPLTEHSLEFPVS